MFIIDFRTDSDSNIIQFRIQVMVEMEYDYENNRK